MPAEVTRRRTELTAHLPVMPESALAGQIHHRQVSFDWGRAWMVYDHPDKIAVFSANPRDRLLPHLRPTADGTQRELLVISPYLIPGRKGLAFFRELRRRGIRIVMLTNSLASTDAVLTHAGYSRYRRELLRMGVELYELKPTAALRRPGTKNASLHAKSFVFDRCVLFVGSLNLDPRSAQLNTEIGVVFESPELAGRLAETLEQKLSRVAWRVEAVPGSEGRLQLNWVTDGNGQLVRAQVEPGCGFWKQSQAVLMVWLPIESQM